MISDFESTWAADWRHSLQRRPGSIVLWSPTKRC